MARVYKFAQKEFGIESELLTFEGQNDASFTYNGKQVLTAGSGSGTYGTRIISTTPLTQNVLNGADSLLTWNSVNLNSTGSGITLEAGVITITKPGIYTLFVTANFAGAYAGGTFGGGIVKLAGTNGQATGSISNVDQGAAVDIATTCIVINKVTAVTVPKTVTLTLNGVGVGGTNSGYQITQNTVDIQLNEVLWA